MTYKIRILENAQGDLIWLRKNDKNRLVYTIYEALHEIDISSFRGHYD